MLWNSADAGGRESLLGGTERAAQGSVVNWHTIRGLGCTLPSWPGNLLDLCFISTINTFISLLPFWHKR